MQSTVQYIGMVSWHLCCVMTPCFFLFGDSSHPPRFEKMIFPLVYLLSTSFTCENTPALSGNAPVIYSSIRVFLAKGRESVWRGESARSWPLLFCWLRRSGLPRGRYGQTPKCRQPFMLLISLYALYSWQAKTCSMACSVHTIMLQNIVEKWYVYTWSQPSTAHCLM